MDQSLLLRIEKQNKSNKDTIAVIVTKAFKITTIQLFINSKISINNGYSLLILNFFLIH